MADAEPILKAFVYSVVSSGIALLIALIPTVDVPVEWVWIVPVVNTALVAAKKTLDGKK